MQQFWCKGRNTAEAKVFALGQGIANAQGSMVRDTNDIARPGFFGNVTFIGKEQHRVMHRHLFARTHMFQLHATFEMTGTQTDEGNAVAMVRVDIGLNLKDKA